MATKLVYQSHISTINCCPFLYPGIMPISTPLTCISITANALTAGGIFTFPLISPALVTHLKLTQPQLTTIVLAAMAGQYPLSSFVGKIIDTYGPNVCSLVASFFFSASFSLFAWEIAKTPDDITQPSASSFHLLTIYFALAGIGTVFAYFCILFSASKTFPKHLGAASGLTTALFGLSPLMWTEVASKWFTDPTTKVLDVSHFLTALAIVAGLTHLVGTFTLRIPSSQIELPSCHVDENTPLVPKHEEANRVIDLLRDRYFWLLLFLDLMNLGICEMVLSNMGTLVLSLPSTGSVDNTSSQVRILSLSNTFSRIVVGPFADFVSPSGGLVRKHRISRIAFLFAASLLLCITASWTVIGIRTQEQLWALSIGVGASYGSILTVLPSIVSSIWGPSNAARNFGVVAYAPAFGTPIYSYLYAFISSHNAHESKVCKGPSCWTTTFSICACSSFIGMFCSLILWRQWKGRL